MSEHLGYPEWLPHEVKQERQLVSRIESGFQDHGFQPLDLAAIQPAELMTAGDAHLSDGGVSKPIFSVTEPPEVASDGMFALRYDLTVPLARYIDNNFDLLRFPLRVYQVNKVWRAERPTKKHWREFYQCDIDVIASKTLHPLYDAELAVALDATFTSLGLGDFVIRISNRKVMEALLAAHGMGSSRVSSIVELIDEAGIGEREELAARLRGAGVERATAEDLQTLVTMQSSEDATGLLVARGADPIGLQELDTTMKALKDLGMTPGHAVVDFAITRGHDYYTGTVFETFAAGREDWGAIGSGGRYDNLMSHVSGKALPGVGVSLGLTRLVALLRAEGGLDQPTHRGVLVTGRTANDWARVVRAVGRLRSHDVPAWPLFGTPPDSPHVQESDEKAVLVTVSETLEPDVRVIGDIDESTHLVILAALEIGEP